MTQISRDDVFRLAQLSKLSLSDDEAKALAVDIQNILQYVEQLNELDTDNVTPSYQVTGLKNIWRTDEVAAGGADRDALLALATETVDNQIKVPKVL